MLLSVFTFNFFYSLHFPASILLKMGGSWCSMTKTEKYLMLLSVKGHHRLNGALSGRQRTEPNSGDYICKNLGFHWTTAMGGNDLGVEYLLGKSASLWAFRTFMWAGPKIIREDNTLSLFPKREMSQVTRRGRWESQRGRRFFLTHVRIHHALHGHYLMQVLQPTHQAYVFMPIAWLR